MQQLRAAAVVLTTGTFLNGLIHIGDKKIAAGRVGEAPALGVSDDLAALGHRGRAYVEHYYSLEAVALRLGRLYLTEARFGARVDRRIARRMALLERDLPPVIAAAPPVPWEAAMAIDGRGEPMARNERRA